MWLEAFGLMLGMVAPCVGEGGSATGAPRLAEPIYTRQTTFGIPFRIDRAQESLQEPVEVQLYVSGDRGATWRLYSRVAPGQGYFAFRAGGDGEYWFTVRTLDRSGQLRPQEPQRPGLRVVVDTSAPHLQLAASQAEAGRITARWQLADPYLNPGTLKLQCRTAATQPWQTVAINREGGAGPVRIGEASWLVSPGAERVEIRAEASDLAGNPAVFHAQVALRADPRTGPPLAMASAVDSVRGRPADSSASDWQAPQSSPATGPSTARASAQAGGSGTVDIQIHPALRSRYVPPRNPAPGSDSLALPPGVRPRIINARVFELDYAVDAVGPSGIARVELWGTRDAGRTWTSFGVDTDQQSPILVTAQEEGVYAFSVCVQNGAGLGGGPPPSGRVPDVWIGVDLTKPDVRLISAEQGTGPQAGQLLLRWEARDWALVAQPVSLFHSGAPIGPWTPIMSGLEGAGQYHWTVDNGVPERIYLRVEARDEAGNLGIYETSEPILLDRLRPSVHIRDVRPLGR